MKTLCNGTKNGGEVTVQFLIEATVITGYAGRKNIFVTQTSKAPSEYTFTLTKTQFPIRLPSLKIVGLHLKNPCFAYKTVVCWLFKKRR